MPKGKNFIIISLNYSGSRYTHSVCTALTGHIGGKHHHLHPNKQYEDYVKIGLYRDPRDIILSTAIRHHNGNIQDGITTQAGRGTVWRDLPEWFARNDFYNFKYEDWKGDERSYIDTLTLILDSDATEEEKDEICVKFDLSVVNQKEFWGKQDKDYQHFGSAPSANKGRIGRWKNIFTREELDEINRRFGTLMEMMGYEIV